jgi:hypothetical protein
VSVVIIRPDETVAASSGSRVGGATTHAVVGDANDASWIEMWPEAGLAQVRVQTPTKPAGSIVKSIQLVGRVSSYNIYATKVDAYLTWAGNTWSAFYGIQTSGTTVVELYGGVVQPGDMTAAQLGDIIIAFRRSSSGASSNARWRDLWIVVVFAEIPTATVTGPTGTTADGNVTAQWNYNQPADGAGQSWYQSVIARTSDGVWVSDSGVVASGAGSHYHPGLPPGTYYSYVNVAQQIYAGQGHWSGWQTPTTFTVPNPVPPDPPAPTVTATGPASLAGTAATGTWNFTAGAGGGVQDRYEAKLFTAAQYGIGGFDPSTSPYTATSGVVTSAATSHAFAGLSPATYRFYVRARQSANGYYSPWSYAQFVLSAPPAPPLPPTYAQVLSVIATPDAADGAIDVLASRLTSADAWTSVDLQRNVDPDLLEGAGEFTQAVNGVGAGWTSMTIATPTSPVWSSQTTGGIAGPFQRMTATLDSGDFIKIGKVVPAAPGDTILIDTMMKGTIASGALARISVLFSKQRPPVDPTVFVADAGTYWVDPVVTATWAPYDLSAVAGAGTRSALVQIEVYGSSGTGKVVSLDTDNVYVTKVVRGWEVVPGSVEAPLDVDGFLVSDYVPIDTPVRYRARAWNILGLSGYWVYSTYPVSVGRHSGTTARLVDPNDQARYVYACVAERPQRQSRARRGEFDIVGDPSPHFTYDRRRKPRGQLVLTTETVAEAEAVREMLASVDVLRVIYGSDIGGIPDAYYSLGDIEETWYDSWYVDWRTFTVQVDEITW